MVSGINCCFFVFVVFRLSIHQMNAILCCYIFFYVMINFFMNAFFGKLLLKLFFCVIKCITITFFNIFLNY